MNNVLLTFIITFSMFTFVCGLSVVWTRECRKFRKAGRNKRNVQYLVEYTKDGKFKSGFTFDAIDKEDKENKEKEIKKEIEKEREKLKERQKEEKDVEKEVEKEVEKYRKIIFYAVVIYYIYKIYKVI